MLRVGCRISWSALPQETLGREKQLTPDSRNFELACRLPAGVASVTVRVARVVTFRVAVSQPVTIHELAIPERLRIPVRGHRGPRAMVRGGGIRRRCSPSARQARNDDCDRDF